MRCPVRVIHFNALMLKLKELLLMCRNIRPLFNFEPPVTNDEVHAAALQYVRKISGINEPSQANEAAFLAAVEAAAAAQRLLNSLETSAPPKDRAVEAAKARARSAQRFARPVNTMR